MDGPGQAFGAAERPGSAPAMLIARPDLLRVVDEAVQHPVTVLAAPPGSGKTTLLAQWVENRRSTGGTVAWVNVTVQDRDPARFWTRLLGSLAPDANLGPALRLLASSADERPAEVAGLLTDEVATAQGVVVVDDVHLIGQAHTPVLSAVVERLPDGVRLILSGRALPALPLGRWLMDWRVAQIHPGSLPMSAEDAVRLLEQSGLRPPDAQVDGIMTFTEGWVGAIRLAAASLRTCGEWNDAAAEEARAAVHDYLAREVFNDQRARVRTFLVRVSLLEVICLPLCVAVTKKDDSDRLLAWILDQNLFLTPHAGQGDAGGQWWRFHPLLRSFLLSRLAREPERKVRLHRRAARWLQKHGAPQGAVVHLLQAGDNGAAAELVSRIGPRLLGTDSAPEVSFWLERLPDAQLEMLPSLWVLRALVAMNQADWGEVARAVAAYENRPDPSPDPALDAEVVGLRAWLTMLRGQSTEAIATAEEALAALRTVQSRRVGPLLLTVGRAHLVAGQTIRAMAACAEAAAVSRSAGDDQTLLTAMTALGRAQFLAGQLHAAEQTFRDGLAEATRGSVPVGGSLHIGLAELLYEWNDVAGAREHLRQGIELARRSGVFSEVLFGAILMAQVEQVEGDDRAADAAITTATRALSRHEMPRRVAGLIDAARVKLWLARGDARAVERWRRGLGDAEERLDPLVRARMQVALGDPGAARAILLGLLARSQGSQQVVRTLQASALLVRATAPADQAEAEHLLAQALERAEPEGFARVFLDEGRDLRALLRRLAGERSRRSGYASRLLRMAETHGRDESQVGTVVLTGREREIMSLTAQGLSNPEIAVQLYVSAGTVKKHLYNAFGKLGARNRWEAVSTARSLGLLLTPADRN